MFKKLRNKFLFLNILVTSLVMLTAFGVVYLTTYNNTKAEIEEKLNNVTNSFTVDESADEEDGDRSFANKEKNEKTFASFNKVASDYVPSFIITVDKSGTIVDVNSLIDISEEQYTQAAATAWSHKDKFDIIIEGRSWMYRVAPIQITQIQNGEQVQTESDDLFEIIFLDVTDMQNNLKNLAFTFLFVGIGMLVVILVISIFYANNAIRPISESWEKQKRFIADASHELKTPLTTIMTNCDVLEANEEETIKSQKEWLSYIKIGADRMSNLVNSLLNLARVDGMRVQAEKESFDISALICGTMQSMNAAIAAKGLFIDRNVEFLGEIYGYEEPVRQVFAILYENAVKYVNEGGRIHVSVRRTKKGVSCTVKNSGRGISAEALPRVFDRFYRANTARSNEENSYGLGLSIAKSIAEQIGGKITATSKENEWTKFVFTFDI